MSRINTNIASMVATRVLNTQNKALNQSLTRLSTGLRINTGKDNPAGLIASEALRSEKVAIGAALTNIQRANNVIGTAEGSLDELNTLLTEMEDLVDRSANEAGISDDERAANQLQIDSILDSINRIASSTEFQGRKILSGELAYTTSAVSSSDFGSVNITSARLPNGGFRGVVVEVTGSAQLATLNYAASATGAGTTTLEIAGKQGTEVLSFASGTAIANVAAAINQSSQLTGVTATVSGAALRINSTAYGSDQFVSVKALEGTFTVTGGDAGPTQDFGKDASVLVDGTKASVKGLKASIGTSTFSGEFELTSTFGTTLGNSTFYVTGGGANFMISPKVSMTGMASLGIQSVSTSNLGTGSLGFLSSLASGQTNDMESGNYSIAQQIVREAATQVSKLRGRLGAFQKDTLETSSNALNITLENTTAAESVIRDTDFASETTNLTKAQILVQSATQVLQIANAQPQQVLRLLGG